MNIKPKIEQLESLYLQSLETGRMPGTGLNVSILKTSGKKIMQQYNRLFYNDDPIDPYQLYKTNYKFHPLRETLLLIFIEFLKTDGVKNFNR